MKWLKWISTVRNWSDYAIRLVLFVVAIGIVNHLESLVLPPPSGPPTFLISMRDGVLVGLPFAAATLWAFFEHSRLRRKLSSYAETDPLTKLINRRTFFWKAAGLSRGPVCWTVALIDIDHFKAVNDTYGHQVGDKCLREFAKHLQGWVGPGDLICRYGGEEFAILFRAGLLDELARRGRVFAAKRPYDLGDQTIEVSCSIGLARWTTDQTLDEALMSADAALYHAKDTGRARLVCFGELSAPEQSAPGVDEVRRRAS